MVKLSQIEEFSKNHKKTQRFFKMHTYYPGELKYTQRGGILRGGVPHSLEAGFEGALAPRHLLLTICAASGCPEL